jgi:hypothetical protein
MPKIKEIIKRMMKIMNRILAISTALAAMPVKPNDAAMIAMTKETAAQ